MWFPGDAVAQWTEEHQITPAAPDDAALPPPPLDETTAAAALEPLYDERDAELVASAWQVTQSEQPMLPPGSVSHPPRNCPRAAEASTSSTAVPTAGGGQRGVPHAAHGRKVTVAAVVSADVPLMAGLC